MQPSKETVTQTIVDVMSQSQFQFEKTEFKLPSFELAFGFEIFIFILLCGCFFLLYNYKHVFSGQTKPHQSLQAPSEAMEFPLSGTPIEKLHALFLKSLQNRKMVIVKKWKTNSDYSAESGLPLFQHVCRLYDAAVYGTKAVPQESVSLLNDEVATWENTP